MFDFTCFNTGSLSVSRAIFELELEWEFYALSASEAIFVICSSEAGKHACTMSTCACPTSAVLLFSPASAVDLDNVSGMYRYFHGVHTMLNALPCSLNINLCSLGDKSFRFF